MSLFGRSSQPEHSGPRSAEDRERARREREARRAAREGRPPPPPFTGDDDGTGNGHHADEPVLADPPAAAAAPEVRVEEPAPDADHAPAAEEPTAHALTDHAPAAEEPASYRFVADAPAEEPPPAEGPEPYAYAEDPASVAETAAAEDPAAQPVAGEPRAEELVAEPPAPVRGFVPDEPPAEDPPPAVEEHMPVEEPPSQGTEDFFAPVQPHNEFADDPSAQEPAQSAANGGSVPMDSWFDDPAPASPPTPEPVTADTGQETVEWDALANAPKERVGAAPDLEPADPADEEPRVERLGPPVAPRTAAARPTSRPAAPVSRPVYGDEDERPVAPKRVPRGGRTLPPPPPPPGERRGKPGRRGRRIAVVVVLALIVGAAALLYNALYQPFAGDPGQRTRVVIPSQSTAADIGRLLQNEGVVQSATFFSLRSRLDGANLKAGTYQLRQDMKYGDAIKALSAGPPAVRTINVTIPEGRSRRETRPIVAQAGLRGSYLQASERSEGFRPSRYGAPRDVSSLEGFLFPATYELRPNATSRQLVRRQLAAFRENIAKVSMRRARAANLDVYDVLIIASMVERESTLAKERPLVASVIYNRLREGMPLGIDATIRFYERNWTRPLRVSELERDSPYNTRKNTGLPPGPIGSPGLASIRAAANPAKTDFLFYVVKPNGDGAHNFSSTDAEFQRDVAAYNRERERRGGQDPSSSDGG